MLPVASADVFIISVDVRQGSARPSDTFMVASKRSNKGLMVLFPSAKI